MAKVEILGVRVDAIRKEGLYEASGEKGSFAYVNINAINIAQRDEDFRAFLDGARIVYCDGEGVRLGGRLLGHRLPSRIALTHWVWDLCAWCEEHGFSIFFLGAANEVVQRAVQNVTARSPRLKVAGCYHGYFEKSGPESDLVISQINEAKPNVLFVGFGMPLQERWIGQNFVALCANAILTCGSMIEYVAGVRSVSPPWMANHGFEWIYRLCQEPHRMWRRYLLGNPLFLIRILFQRVKQGRL